MTKRVTAAEYARLRGVSRNAVSKAIAAGRIATVAGPNNSRLIDVDQANVDWARNTDIGRQRQGAPKEFAKTQALARESSVEPGAESQAPAVPKASGNGFGLSLIEEKTRSERLRIRRQEIELEQLEGLSVSREAVVAALSAKLMSAAETLQGIPDRFAAVFAAETDAAVIHRLLSSEIRAAMAAISTVPDALH